MFFKTEIEVLACQILDKIMEFGPNQVHMAPFGLIRSQNGSYMVWDASGMPPGLQNPPKNPKIQGFGEIPENPGIPLFSL